MLELGCVSPQVNSIFSYDSAATICIDEVIKETERDVLMQKVIKSLGTGKWDSEIKHMKAFADEFFVTKGILMRGHQIVMPNALRRRAMVNAHVAHSGVVVMKNTLRSKMW